MTPEGWIRILLSLGVLWILGFAIAYLEIRRANQAGITELPAGYITQLVVIPPLVGITVLVISVLILGL